MDFGAMPPEINSGRMYAGPGPAPMLAAAAAWGGLAGELGATTSSYDSVITGLLGQQWFGPSALSMASAATPYVAWLRGVAGLAEQTATQARMAAAAFDTAFAATVPPAVVAANRTRLMTLVATNVLGQNTAAIAATEVEYTEMWAQDVAAMYGYAAAAAAATRLTPFPEPPQTTNPVGAAANAVAQSAAAAGQSQSLASQLSSVVPQTLQNFAAAALPAQADPITPVLDALAGPLSPISLFGIGGIPYLLAIQCVLLPMNGANVVASVVRAEHMAAEGIWTPGVIPVTAMQPMTPVAAGAAASPVSAVTANAASVGRLSVPAAWAAGVEAEVVAATAVSAPASVAGSASLALEAGRTGMVGDMALGGMAGRALGVAGGLASTDGRSTKARADKSDKKPAKPSKATIIVIPPSARD